MEITFDTIVSDTKYEPSIARCRYEIGHDTWIRLKRPTVSLRREAFMRADELKDDAQADYKLAHLIAEPEGGKAWPAPDDSIPETISAAVADFFMLLMRTYEKALGSSEASSQSAEAEPLKQDGSLPGDSAETVGETSSSS